MCAPPPHVPVYAWLGLSHVEDESIQKSTRFRVAVFKQMFWLLVLNCFSFSRNFLQMFGDLSPVLPVSSEAVCCFKALYF